MAELYNCPEKLARCHRHSGNFGCEALSPHLYGVLRGPPPSKKAPRVLRPGWGNSCPSVFRQDRNICCPGCFARNGYLLVHVFGGGLGARWICIGALGVFQHLGMLGEALDIHLEIDSGPTDPKCRPRGPLRSPTFPFHSRRTYTASPSPCLPCGCECWGYGLGQPPRTNICNGRRGFDRARIVYLIANRWSNTDQFPKLQRLGTCTTLNFRAVRRSYYRAFGAEHSESSTARAFNL